MRSKSKSSKRILNYSPLLILLIILSLSIVSAQAPVKSNEPYNFTRIGSGTVTMSGTELRNVWYQKSNSSSILIKTNGAKITRANQSA